MGSDEPRKVVRLRGPKVPDAVVAPELLNGPDSPFYNPIFGGTPAQLRWLRSLRGYLTLYYGWRDLIPPKLFPPSELDRLLRSVEKERDERWHDEWVKRTLRRLLKGEKPKDVFKFGGVFHGTEEEHQDLSMSTKAARVLKSEKLRRLAEELDPYFHFPNVKEELSYQNMALEVARLLKSDYALALPERKRVHSVINIVAIAFDNADEKVVRLARDRWRVTDEQVVRWIRTLKQAGKLKR